MTIEDYVGILRRHLWVIVLPTLVFPLLAYLASLLLPEVYTSQTLVLVENQKVPEVFVRSVVTDQLNERLGTMTQQILSRSRLQPIIERMGLYQEDQGRKVPMEELVNRMRKAIVVNTIKPVVTSRQGELPGFTVSFNSDNPRTAQMVCQELVSMFIEENLKLRSQRAGDTTGFLQKQLEEAKRVMDEKDAQLRAFKQKYLGQLPGQEQANMNILMNLTTQLEAVTQLLTRTHQDKTYAESLLQQQIAAWEAAQAGNNPQTLETQLAALQNQLLTLEGRYKPEHPDVVRLKGDIEQLKKKIEESEAEPSAKAEEKAAVAKTIEPPQIQGLRNQIYQYEQTIKEKTRDQERIQESIKVYRSRVEISPLVEEQFKNITRDYATAQGFFDQLLRKKQDADMGKKMEDLNQAEQFRLVDPANLPETPSFPDRRLFAAGGLGGGLALGLGIVLLLELKDKSLRTERDIEALLHLPTLALVPALESRAVRRGLLSRLRRTPERALPSAAD